MYGLCILINSNIIQKNKMKNSYLEQFGQRNLQRNESKQKLKNEVISLLNEASIFI